MLSKSRAVHIKSTVAFGNHHAISGVVTREFVPTSPRSTLCLFTRPDQSDNNQREALVEQPVFSAQTHSLLLHLLSVNNSSRTGSVGFISAPHGYATVSPALKYTVMERSSDASAEVVTLQLEPGEVLALYGFLALGAHFAAVISGEDSPFSPDEIRSHIATIGETASDTLMAKLVEAGTAVRDRARLPMSSPSIDET